MVSFGIIIAIALLGGFVVLKPNLARSGISETKKLLSSLQDREKTGGQSQ